MAVFRSENDRDHMLAEELGAFLRALLAPARALGLNFAHPHGNLCRTQRGDRDGFDKGITDGRRHGRLLGDG